MTERTVYDASGAPIVLTGPVKKGGEGEIYLTGTTDDLCAKLYYERRITSLLQAKIAAMVNNSPAKVIAVTRGAGPRGSALAWPLSLLYDSPLGSRSFVGYLMPLIDTRLYMEAHRFFDPDDRIRLFGGGFSWRYLLTAAYNFASVMADIHARGHCIGDVSSRNLLIARTAAVAIIDCDSFQILDTVNDRIFYSHVGTGEYLPPELQGVDFGKEDADRYASDLFALGVMIFRLLMGGVHPFQASGEGVSDVPSIEQKIKNGKFAYVTSDPSVSPPKFAYDYAIIPPALQDLFSRCFVEGAAEPLGRPPAEEWKRMLLAELMEIRHCSANPNHWYGKQLSTCPWCRYGEENDPFPRWIRTPDTAGETEESSRSVEESGSEPVIGASAAELILPDPHITIHDVARDIVIPYSLVIKNKGEMALHGTAESTVPWITVIPRDFTCEDRKVLTLEINTGDMDEKDFQKAKIQIYSNGGNAEAIVFVSLQPDS